jgi:hypothetical protein
MLATYIYGSYIDGRVFNGSEFVKFSVTWLRDHRSQYWQAT